jgi:hypothetical protein
VSRAHTRPNRSRRNGLPRLGRRPEEPRLGPVALLAPIIGATIIVLLAWAASLEQATPEIFVAASLVFAIAEGIVLAFVGAVWSVRGLPWAVGIAVLTAVLATPGRWEVAYLRTSQRPQLLDLGSDAAVTLVWAIFAGLAGATILRERLRRLLPLR